MTEHNQSREPEAAVQRGPKFKSGDRVRICDFSDNPKMNGLLATIRFSSLMQGINAWGGTPAWHVEMDDGLQCFFFPDHLELASAEPAPPVAPTITLPTMASLQARQAAERKAILERDRAATWRSREQPRTSDTAAGISLWQQQFPQDREVRQVQRGHTIEVTVKLLSKIQDPPRVIVFSLPHNAEQVAAILDALVASPATVETVRVETQVDDAEPKPGETWYYWSKVNYLFDRTVLILCDANPVPCWVLCRYLLDSRAEPRTFQTPRDQLHRHPRPSEAQ